MHEKSIELLNTAIADEIAAIHQYMYFHFRLDDLGYTPLANLLKQTAIEEMQHAEMIAERILFLGGEVEMKVGREVEKIHDVGSMLEKAHALEQEAIQMYNRFAVECAQNADSGSKKLFEDLVAAEEAARAAAEAAELADQRYEAGLVALLSVLDTERTLFSIASGAARLYSLLTLS